MANDKTFFQWQESRALSGYKSAWLVKRREDSKYSLIGATETVPYPFGEHETFEYDLLQAPTKGQVEGKMTLESTDIEVLHHRDNAYRYEKLEGEILDFLSVNAEYVGYKFIGTLSYRPNNAEADINRATVTITPMSAETTPIYDARELVQETLCFKTSIPATVKVGEKVDFTPIQTTTATISAVKIAAGTNAETAADTSDITTTAINQVEFKTTGLFAVTVSAADYTSWTTTVYVEPAAQS